MLQITSEDRKARLDLELSLLQKGKWGFRDVMKYYKVGKNTAYSIIRTAISKGGKCEGDTMMVAYSKAIIATHDGSTPLEEIEKRAMERRYL